MKITPRDNLIDTIEFNFYQGGHAFDRSFWDKYIDAIEEKLQADLEKAEKIIDYYAKETTDIIAVKARQYFREKDGE